MGNRMSLRRRRRVKRESLARANDTKEIAELLGNDINATALHTGAELGNLKVVKYIVQRRPDLLNARTSDGRTALHLALDKKHEHVSTYLINMCADVKAKDKLGATALHYLCRTAFSWEVAKLIQFKGVNLDAVTDDGASALHLLCRKVELGAELNQWKICQLLLSKLCQVDLKDRDGLTPLYHAARNGLFEVCRILIDYGADCNALSVRKLTPLHAAAYKGYQEIVMLLLDNGAYVDAQGGPNKWTPLHYAAQGGFDSLVEVLVSTYNADPSLVDVKGRTPLYMAVTRQKQLAVACLLDPARTSNYLVDVNASTLSKSKTALNRAVKLGNREIVAALFNNGAYFNMSTRFPIPLEPRWTALMRNDKHLRELLGLIDTLFKSAKRNDLKGVQSCVEKGAPVNARDQKSGRTALHFAAVVGNLQMVEYLLGQGARCDLLTSDGLSPLNLTLLKGNHVLAPILIDHASVTLSPVQSVRFFEARSLDTEQTALHLAAASNQFQIVKMLIRSGARYNARDAKGLEPKDHARDKLAELYFEAVHSLFKYANSGDAVAVSKLLNDYPTIVNARDMHDGSTALYWSLHNNHTDTAKILLTFGADGRLVTDSGQTALHIASERGNEEIIDFLIKRCSRLDADAYVNFRTFGARLSALHLASNVGVARQLLYNGACYNIKDCRGRTPRDFTRNNDIKRLLDRTDQLWRKLQSRLPNVKERAENEPQDLQAIRGATEDLASAALRSRTKLQDYMFDLDLEGFGDVETVSKTLTRRHTMQHVRTTKV